MIYLEIDDNELVALEHHHPFDDINGLNKSNEQLEQTGILVDTIPKPNQLEGKHPVMYANFATKEIYYKYIDIPKTETELLKEQLEQQNKAIADLTMAIAMTQTPSV